jgi:uncharacterized cupin superfamily protein
VSGPVNLYEAVLDDDPAQPAGYCRRMARLGPVIGAERLGGSVYELSPGESICPYHYEGVEEEWLIVLGGAPILRDPEGEHELVEGDVVCFPVGPGGAHKLTNRSQAIVRLLMLSTMPVDALSISVYPDSEKVGVWPWPGMRLRMGGVGRLLGRRALAIPSAAALGPRVMSPASPSACSPSSPRRRCEARRSG